MTKTGSELSAMTGMCPSVPVSKISKDMVDIAGVKVGNMDADAWFENRQIFRTKRWRLKTGLNGVAAQSNELNSNCGMRVWDETREIGWSETEEIWTDLKFEI